jgi:hypothetical protein
MASRLRGLVRQVTDRKGGDRGHHQDEGQYAFEGSHHSLKPLIRSDFPVPPRAIAREEGTLYGSLCAPSLIPYSRFCLLSRLPLEIFSTALSPRRPS